MSHARILNHDVVSSRYFFPRHGPIDAPTVIEVDGAELHCIHHAPHPGAPTVLHFHGNGEVVADWTGDFARGLAERGLNVFFAEYRGYGGSSGAPQLARMLDDALAIADHCAAEAGETLLVYGRSVGSIYALHVAANRPVVGLVIESGIADVHERIALRVRPEELGTTTAGLRAATAALFDHKSKIEACACPVLAMHARGDDLVPPSHGQRLAEWAGERGRLRLFDRGDHNSIHVYNGTDILDELARFAAESQSQSQSQSQSD